MLSVNDAIPSDAGGVDGWRFVLLKECGEPLVAIGEGTEYSDILACAVYAGEHPSSPYRGALAIEAAEPVIYLRRSVAERLRHAQATLPNGLRLVVFDGYRSVQVQQALYDQFLDELRDLRPSWSDGQLRDETERYVSLPSTSTSCPSPHLTGGAVDVAILKDGRMLEFGTPFDHGTERSALRYFEDSHNVHTEADEIARDNRRLLYRVMHEAGFEGFMYEWWHFNAPETQMGARSGHRECAVFGNGTPHITKNTFSRDEKVNSNLVQLYLPIDRIAPTN